MRTVRVGYNCERNIIIVLLTKKRKLTKKTIYLIHVIPHPATILTV